jgi:hypothetical protein
MGKAICEFPKSVAGYAYGYNNSTNSRRVVDPIKD